MPSKRLTPEQAEKANELLETGRPMRRLLNREMTNKLSFDWGTAIFNQSTVNGWGRGKANETNPHDPANDT